MVYKPLFFVIAAFIAAFPGLGSLATAQAQEQPPAEKRTATLNLICQKNTDASLTFSVEMTISVNDLNHPLSLCKIAFLAGQDNPVEIGVRYTNAGGKCSLDIPAGRWPKPDQEGIYYFMVRFDGSDTLEAASSEVKFKDIRLVLAKEEQDSARTLKVRCYKVSDKGEELPEKDMDVIFYVARMFSRLKIGEGKTDENGMCSLEFPEGLPGDTAGNLKMLARIEGNEIYGNVESVLIAPWGIPTSHIVLASHRALWTQIAPKWMIITLIIMLSGVWGHYMFAIYKITRIRKEGKRAAKKAQEPPALPEGDGQSA